MSAILSWFGLDMAALIGAVFGFLFEQGRAFLKERRAEQTLKDLGRETAQREGAEAISKIADEQIARATNPPTDDELLDRFNRGTG